MWRVAGEHGNRGALRTCGREPFGASAEAFLL
jgi:hypothetical protein